METKENHHSNKPEKNSPQMTEFMADLYESTIEAARDFSVIYRQDQKKEAPAQNGEAESYQGNR